MEQRNTRLRNAGFVTFFFSGICTISSGVVVSLLQEEYGFAYGMTGTLLSLMATCWRACWPVRWWEKWA